MLKARVGYNFSSYRSQNTGQHILSLGIPKSSFGQTKSMACLLNLPLQGWQVSCLDLTNPWPLAYTDGDAKFALLLTELEGQI